MEIIFPPQAGIFSFGCIMPLPPLVGRQGRPVNVAAVRCAFRNNNEPGNINNNNNNGFRVVASYFSPYFVEKFQS